MSSLTEAKFSAAKDELDDVTTCSICHETYRNPKILPCVHSFCLTCLKDIGAHTNRNPGDSMACPLCRQEFTIPEHGFAALKKNFFMVRLIEITTVKNEASSVCATHENENLCLYCSECHEVACLVCIGKCHQNHRLSDLSSAADILRPLLENNFYTAKQCMVDALKKKERLRDKKSVVLKKIKRLELEVNLIRCELKALIDRDADSLVQNLRSLQEEQLEDIDIEEDDLDKHLDGLRNFKVSCSDLTSDDCHVSLFCKTASELNKQIVGLKQMSDSIVERQPLEVKFTRTVPMALETYKTKNIIGAIKATIDYSGRPELVRVIETNSTTSNKGDVISGMAVTYNDVFIVYRNSPVVCIFDSRTHRCTTRLTLEDFVREVDLRDCVSVAGNVYIVNGIASEILRIDQNRDFLKWSTGDNLGCLSVSAQSTIVATCNCKTGALMEYSLQGRLNTRIKLCPTIVHPHQAIKLCNGHFVVCHGGYGDTVKRVCMINNAGGITKSFDRSSNISSSLYGLPVCLAVDENGNILVLDRSGVTSRVLLLSAELEFKRELLRVTDGLRRPTAMHLEEKTGQLYIADNNSETSQQHSSRVLVFNII